MKTIRLRLTENALLDKECLLREIISYLNEGQSDYDYDVYDNKYITEHDLETDEFTDFYVCDVKENFMGTYDVSLDC